MHDRTPWTRGATGNHVIKNRTYKNLTEFSRPCQACGNPFSIFVTSKIADGLADSNSFGLKNCEHHRRNKSAGDTPDVEIVRMENNVMRQELEGLYSTVADLTARLAQYELAPAMHAAAPQNKMPWE